jgi:hypothetical protein
MGPKAAPFSIKYLCFLTKTQPFIIKISHSQPSFAAHLRPEMDSSGKPRAASRGLETVNCEL